jgi:hypothetical protein
VKLFSIEVTGRKIVLVPAEVVPEFVKIGDVNFIAKGGGVVLGEVPEIAQKEEDLRGDVVEGFAVGRADKEAKNIGLELSPEYFGSREIMGVDGDFGRVDAELGG